MEYLFLLHKYPILDMGLFHTTKPTVVQIQALGKPCVPKKICYDKKLEHFKTSLTAMKKSKDNWNFFINLTASNAFFPWLSIEVQGHELLHLAHNLLYGEDSTKALTVKLELEVTYLNRFCGSAIQSAIIEQILDPIPHAGTSKIFGKRNIPFPKELLDGNLFWNMCNRVVSYYISISVDVSKYAPLVDFHHLARNLNQKLLDDTSTSDFKIIAKDGTPFHCHKIFLSAHSDVLAAMLQGSFIESQNEQLVWKEMPADGVKSFLEFLYYGETQGAVKNCEIALHMFIAADKYNIKSLGQAMSQLFYAKCNDWYTVDTAWKFYQFLMYYEGEDKQMLISKVLQVLASWNASQLEEKIKNGDISDPKLLKNMLFHSVKNLEHYITYYQNPDSWTE